MKKAKILAVFGILLAMGITACNKGNEGGDVQSQDTPATSQDGGDSKSEHKHVYGDWKQTKAPTCTEAGQEEQKCECGDTKTRSVKALGHDWGEWTEKTAATCTEDGVEERVCKRDATHKETRPIKAEHKYGDPQTVAASGEGVEYTKEVCSVDGIIRLKVNQSKVTYAAGSSRKGGTPDGYTKLNSNGNSMSFKFNYDHFAIGKLYLFGVMDGYSTDSNKAAGLYYQGNPNVEIKMNGNVVDVSAQRDTKYSDIFGTNVNETEFSSPGDKLSDEGYFPIGDIVLQNGVNELIYKRVQTLNMLIKDFVFVVENSTHTHTAATTWSSNETTHWHACTDPNCPTKQADTPAAHTFEDKAEDDRNKVATCSEEGAKVEKCSVCGYEKVTPIAKIAHTYPNEGEYTQKTAPTCDTAGEEERECSVCHEKDTKVIPALGHNFGEAVENYAAGEGYIASTAHNCSRCDASSLRWKATDYDVTKTTDRSTAVPESRGSGQAIRWSSTPNYDGQDTTKKGCHVVYNINVPADVENAGLSFKTSKRDDVATIFDKVDNDNSKGYEYVNEELVRPDSRYGLKIDGNVVLVNKDTSGQTWQSGIAWYRWPVSLNLTAGVHEIEIYNLGGYRADMYEFELTGLPHVTPSHIHNGDDAWLTDENNHWHACTAEGCPIADGIYDKATHTFGEKYDEVPATCSANGSYKQKCTVCNYEKTVVTEKLDHTWGEAQTAVGDAIPHECSVCHAVCYELAVASPTKLKADLTWNITGLPAGNYEIHLNACASSTTLPQKYDSRYQFKVDSGDYIGASNDNATYADYGLGTGEAIDNVKWSKTINQIVVGADAASFTIHWTNKGYSAFIAGVRLVKIAA